MDRKLVYVANLALNMLRFCRFAAIFGGVFGGLLLIKITIVVVCCCLCRKGHLVCYKYYDDGCSKKYKTNFCPRHNNSESRISEMVVVAVVVGWRGGRNPKQGGNNLFF